MSRRKLPVKISGVEERLVLSVRSVQPREVAEGVRLAGLLRLGRSRGRGRRRRGRRARGGRGRGWNRRGRRGCHRRNGLRRRRRGDGRRCRLRLRRLREGRALAGDGPGHRQECPSTPSIHWIHEYLLAYSVNTRSPAAAAERRRPLALARARARRTPYPGHTPPGRSLESERCVRPFRRSAPPGGAERPRGRGRHAGAVRPSPSRGPTPSRI